MTVNDLSYDVLTALQSKLESVAAYETFIEDCEEAGDTECRQLFEQMRERDEQDAEKLTSTLERLVREGKLH
jgi:ferritin-like metal-binding protein YciE